MPANRHVKQTLPPSLDGLPSQAVISYFVKATVQRAAILKENFRAVSLHAARLHASAYVYVRFQL